MKKTLSWGLLILAFLAFASLGNAQEITATISGVVSDASNAVVPNASVVIHSNSTNLDIRTVTTGNNGEYVAANLPAGTYTVTVKNPGFQTWTSRNVVVNVAEKRTLDIQLSIGKVAETIEVSSSTQPVETTSSEQSQTITGTQVRELELSNRNFQQLVALQPGVSANWGDQPGFGITSGTAVAVNGARNTANNWTVDGADINDSGSNGTLLNVPSIDAIQEFTLQRSNYDASSGRSGGGQVLVATKSGTSDFHGSVYEFFRNDYLNANSYFSNATDTPRSIERYNDYGFTVGGPIWIPKKSHKSAAKTFFFWSEEWRKVSSPGNNTFTNIPTSAELGGTFTGLAADPTPFLNNPACGTVTPPSGSTTTYSLQLNLAVAGCSSQNSQAYVSSIFSKYPANLNGTDYYYAYSAQNNFHQDIIRVDQVINDKIRFYGRYMHDDAPENAPLGLWGSYTNFPGVASDTLDAPGRNVVGDLTWTITPRLTNEVEYVYTWGGIDITEAGIIDSSAFTSQLTNNWSFPDTYGRGPNLGIEGSGYAAGPGNAPYHERNIDQSIIDNASYVVGPHALRFGLSFQFMEKTENATSGDASFSFSNAYQTVGANQVLALPGLAQFLLGQNAGYSQANKDTIPDLHYKNVEFYLQDDWKVTRRLTLNLGLRYSYFPTPYDLGNTLVNFDPRVFQSGLAPAIDPDYGTMVDGQGINAANYANGLIFPTGATCTAAKAIASNATCSPFGSTINPNGHGNLAPRLGFAWDPFGNGKTAIRGGYGIFYDRSLNGIFEQNSFGDPPLVQFSNVPSGPFDSILSGSAAGPSLGPSGLTVTGSPDWHTPYYTAFNLSVQREILPNTKLEVAYVGGLGTHLLGDVDLNQPTLAARLDPTNQADAVNVNYLRPYAGFGRITSRNPEFTSNYNSLQITLNRQVSRGLNIGVAYTYSKALTTNTDDRGSPANDTYNLKMDYGPSGYSTPQILIFNYVYDLPWYKGQQGFVGHVLGGWEISGITTFQSGQPLTIYQNNDPFSLYNATLGNGDGGLGIYYPRADRTSTAISNTKTVSQWFNPSAFTDAVGHFGTSTNGQLLGPGQQVWDIGFIKNTNVSERLRLQFRGEFFNAFNHANFWGVDNNVDDGSFGAVTSTHLPRNIQLALKLYF
jgi:Carboxypeptidase regulatory-like domain/TonB-dependent Receptor Plug Domain